MATSHVFEDAVRDMALKATAFASSSTSQLLLFFHQYEVEFLVFALFSSLFLFAYGLHLVLPEIHDEYHLFPTEVSLEDEDFTESDHCIMALGFGVTGIIINVWPILGFVQRVSTKLARYSWESWMVTGMALVLLALGNLAFHDGHDKARRVNPEVLILQVLALVVAKACWKKMKLT